MQQESGALLRRQPVEREQKRKGEIVGEFGRSFRRKAVGVEHRLGKPGTDIDFPLRLGAFEPIETEPRHDRDEKRFRIAHVLGIREPQIGVLHHIFGVASAAEHAIGEPEQPSPVGRDRIAFMRPA